MIALIDCNNFYASCEKAFKPGIADKPVVVLSNNDGCIIARSQEAKDIGINMTEPFFKIKEDLKQMGVQVFSSNYTLYGDMSTRVVECIDAFSDEVEIYSVDEAFAKFTFQGKDALEQARKLRNRIHQWVGIPVKIGLGSSKTLAKIATRQAKLSIDRTCMLSEESQIKHVLGETKISDLWGIGRGFHKFFTERNISTALQFRELPNSFIRQHMGVVGLRMAYELRGLSCIPLVTRKKQRQHIMTSRSFSHAITDYKEMKEAVSTYTARCAEKLRQEQLTARGVSVFLRTYEHKTHLPQRNVDLNMFLSTPTESTPELIQAALEVLAYLYKDGYRYKKAGVLLTHLEPVHTFQYGIFQHRNHQKNHSLMKAMDSLNQKHGKNTVRVLSEGIEQSWTLSADYLSKRATTHWDELIEI